MHQEKKALGKIWYNPIFVYLYSWICMFSHMIELNYESYFRIKIHIQGWHNRHIPRIPECCRTTWRHR
jgi:hypothetical protein